MPTSPAMAPIALNSPSSSSTKKPEPNILVKRLDGKLGRHWLLQCGWHFVLANFCAEHLVALRRRISIHLPCGSRIAKESFVIHLRDLNLGRLVACGRGLTISLV
jgi:hypothetical protein